jgi:general stress protein 26
MSTTDTNVKKASPENLEQVQQLINKVKVAMLTTQEPDHTLRSRPMVIKTENFSGVVSFLTAIDTPKIDELQQNAEVNVSLASPGDAIFMSLSGKARVNQNQTEIDRLWSEADKLWFPEGKDSKRIAVISVQVSQVEYWSSNKLVAAFHMAKDYIQGEHYEGEGTQHEKLNVNAG